MVWKIVVFGKVVMAGNHKEHLGTCMLLDQAYPNCVKDMECVMQHILCMPERGLAMQPDGVWDGG